MILKPFSDADEIRAAYRILTEDTAVDSAGGWGWPVSIEKYVKEKMETWGVTDSKFQLVVVEAGRVIGVVIVSGIDKMHRRAYVGVILDKDYRGAGNGTQAIAELKRLCFRRYGLEKLYAEVYVTNVASQKLFEKSGFDCEAVLREHDVVDGERVPVLLYGCCLGKDM